MSDNPNIDFLVNELVKIKFLNDRYKELICVNWPPDSEEGKRGYFSLVFKAFDTKEGKYVAIKFYDPSHLSDDYRLNCFKREPTILTQLKDKNRCLQLVEDMTIHIIKVVLPDGFAIDLPCSYFVTDWVDFDIDNYFLGKEEFAAKIKLIVFRHIISAVEAIHNCSVFHRDLKPDNMRTDSQKAEDGVVLVIDFGTAARYDSGKLMKEYANVGATAYSAPETFLGFAGERNIAKFTDIYALGCLLYELFNDSIYFKELYNNPNFNIVLTAIGLKLSTYKSMEERIKNYSGIVNNYLKMVEPPDFFGVNCTLPSSLSGIILPLYCDLVKFNYISRLNNFELIRSRIDIAIRILDNEAYQQKLLERRKIFRLKAIDKLQRKEAKLINYLNNVKRLPC